MKISFELKKDTRFEKLFTAVPNQFNVKPGEFRLLFEGHQLHDNDTPAQLEMYDYETVELYLVQRGGIPAIYLLSATPLEMVTVSVSLQPGWDFTVIYPLTTKTKHDPKSTSEITWVVSVQTDGTLVNRLTGRQSSYLFWEAITIPSHMLHLSPSDERGPKAVARVFMLFRGVNHDCTKDCDKQHEYGTELPSEVDWTSVIGLDVDGMKDESAFRVVEWGGMEVTMTIPN